MAVKLSGSRGGCLMWFRKVQLTCVTWAGDSSRLMVGDDPTHLSSRRCFAAWREIVRGTALPRSNAERVMARATALVAQIRSLSDWASQTKLLRPMRPAR